MKKIVFLVALSIVIISCSSDDSKVQDLQEASLVFNCEDSPEGSEWYQNLIDSMDCGQYSCKISLLQSTYQGQTVFYTQITDELCFTQVKYTLYNCEGKVVKEMTVEESREYLNNSNREVEELFSCNEID